MRAKKQPDGTWSCGTVLGLKIWPRHRYFDGEILGPRGKLEIRARRSPESAEEWLLGSFRIAMSQELEWQAKAGELLLELEAEERAKGDTVAADPAPAPQPETRTFLGLRFTRNGNSWHAGDLCLYRVSMAHTKYPWTLALAGSGCACVGESAVRALAGSLRSDAILAAFEAALAEQSNA
jgi:hypothetical protein